MKNVKIELHTDACKAAIEKAIIAALYEAAGEVQAGVVRHTRVDTGQLKDSWKYIVDEAEKVATIGSPLENAIWEEFGTGEHAINGNGKKGFAGKAPSRALHKAFTMKKHIVKKLFEKKFEQL